MLKFICDLENKTIHKYGFEHPHTVRIFKFTEILRKISKNY